MKLSLKNGESYTRNDVNGNEYCDCLNEASLQFESHKMTCWKAPIQFGNVPHCAAMCAALCVLVLVCAQLDNTERSGNSQSWCTVSGYLMQRTYYT